MALHERKKEIKRRRKRRENYAAWKQKLEGADAATREKIREKLRKISCGAEDMIKEWGLAE